MKVFAVEMKRESYTSLIVEAENEDDAIDQSLKMHDSDGKYVHWSVNEIEEVSP